MPYRYRISLFSQWKQRGMYAMCMWIVQLLLVLSKVDSVFVYIPEFYLEALVYRILFNMNLCKNSFYMRVVWYVDCLFYFTCCIKHIENSFLCSSFFHCNDIITKYICISANSSELEEESFGALLGC